MLFELVKKIFAPQSEQHERMRRSLFNGLEEKYKEDLLKEKGDNK